MDDYSRAAARVHAALCSLQAVPEHIRAHYADDFTQELYAARSVRKRLGRQRMPFILSLTELIAGCKPEGTYGLIPLVFAREIARFTDEPDERWTGDLGENQWWQRIGHHDAASPDGADTRTDSAPSTPPGPDSPHPYYSRYSNNHYHHSLRRQHTYHPHQPYSLLSHYPQRNGSSPAEPSVSPSSSRPRYHESIIPLSSSAMSVTAGPSALAAVAAEPSSSRGHHHRTSSSSAAVPSAPIHMPMTPTTATTTMTMPTTSATITTHAPSYVSTSPSSTRKRKVSNARLNDGPYNGDVIDARPPEDKFKFEMWTHDQHHNGHHHHHHHHGHSQHGHNGSSGSGGGTGSHSGSRPPAKYARYNPDDPSPPKGYELTEAADRCQRCQERNIECWRGKKRKRASGACWNCHKLKRPCSMAKDWFAAKQFTTLAETYENDPGSMVVLQLNESGKLLSPRSNARAAHMPPGSGILVPGEASTSKAAVANVGAGGRNAHSVFASSSAASAPALASAPMLSTATLVSVHAAPAGEDDASSSTVSRGQATLSSSSPPNSREDSSVRESPQTSRSRSRRSSSAENVPINVASGSGSASTVAVACAGSGSERSPPAKNAAGVGSSAQNRERRSSSPPPPNRPWLI